MKIVTARKRLWVVFSGNGRDLIGGMAGDGRGEPFDTLPSIAQEAILDDSYEYVEDGRDRYIRSEGGR